MIKVVGFVDLSIDIFLEVQNEKYSEILYLIEYNAHGVHFCSKITNLNENLASGSKKMFQSAAKCNLERSLLVLKFTHPNQALNMYI